MFNWHLVPNVSNAIITGFYQPQLQSALMGTQHWDTRANFHWRCSGRGNRSVGRPCFSLQNTCLLIVIITHGGSDAGSTTCGQNKTSSMNLASLQDSWQFPLGPAVCGRCVFQSKVKTIQIISKVMISRNCLPTAVEYIVMSSLHVIPSTSLSLRSDSL